jgi:hypothetical protein
MTFRSTLYVEQWGSLGARLCGKQKRKTFRLFFSFDKSLLSHSSTKERKYKQKKHNRIMQIERSLYLLLLAVVVSFTAAEECAESTCIAENEGCTHNPEGCCDGLGCFGYNFFKRCRTPPACLAEWYDCSNSMPCCGDLVCAVTEGGASECQVRTLETNLTGADLISTSAPFVAPVPVPVPAPLPTPVAVPVAVAPVRIPTSSPTLPPSGPNLKTTTIPGAAVKTKTACAVGDPHIYRCVLGEKSAHLSLSHYLTPPTFQFRWSW